MTNGEIIEALELILAVDRTSPYEPNEPRAWDGAFPVGKIWPTPREVAIAALRRIREENCQ